MLDTFNRANGAIGSSWTGQNDSSFTVSSNQLAINSSGLDSFAAWSPASFGADQEAYVTLTQLSASGLEQGLLLKTAADASAALKVVYVASANVVRVFTYTFATGWAQRGADISVTMNNGDQLGARAKANGDVEVYRNGSLLGTVSVTAWTPYSGGGYIGLWYSNASGAIVDDFGGGNVSASATPTNTSAPTSTNTSTITRTPTVTTSPAGTMTPSRTLTPANTLTPSRTPTITASATLTNTPTFTPAFTSTPTSTPPASGPVTINYVYDPLYRLTEASYSNGNYYHYAYDAVGNRTEQQTLIGSVPLTNNYAYDAANRLSSVDSTAYTWDNNGNLLNDGVNTYVYDSANRLTTISNQQSASSYQYSGLGDRLTQSVNGDTTNYTLDLNTSLPEVLSDGQFTYLYGLDNIAQVNSGGTQYFLGDALNSTRQLTDANAEITLAQSYDPFGSVSFSAGNGQSVYGYTSEQSDPSGLVYLRARYYSPEQGRFTAKDTWAGNINQPSSLNRWMYVEGNPINYTDPSGYSPVCDNGDWDRCGIPDWWKRRSHLYVEGYGYFDTGHIKRGWTSAKWFIEEIESTLKRGGGVFQNPATSSEGVGAESEIVYWAYYSISENLARKYKNNILDEAQILGIAYGMYIDFERGYENYQSQRRDITRFSAFSPEDLPSDHLGFWAYMSGLDLDEIPSVLECLGDVNNRGESPLGSLIIDAYYNRGYFNISVPKNYEFLPMVTDLVVYRSGAYGTHTRNIPWPSWLKIEPIPSGPYTWQKFIEGHK